MNFGREAWRFAFEISPIILTRGIASLGVNGMLPILALTEPGNFFEMAIGGNFTIDQMFAHWEVLPGTGLIKNTVGKYPFFNQIVASNAIIQEPLSISFIMNCPAQNTGGMYGKISTIAGLKTALDYHIQNGGTFTLLTPSYIYTDCLLTEVKSVQGEDKQIQSAWQFDFEKPLITNPEENGKSTLMQKISAGVPVPADQLTWSAVGNNAISELTKFTNGIAQVF